MSKSCTTLCKPKKARVLEFTEEELGIAKQSLDYRVPERVLRDELRAADRLLDQEPAVQTRSVPVLHLGCTTRPTQTSATHPCE